MTETPDWRAVCGKTARTVRREGSGAQSAMAGSTASAISAIKSALIALTVGMAAPTQAGLAPTSNGHVAKPKPTWRQTQIHANYFR
jgi:hypothetical protein